MRPLRGGGAHESHIQWKMVMSTFTFEDVQLDPGDMGIVWIPGIGFRPKDPTEEIQFCGQEIGEASCTSGTCGKWALTEKWDVSPEWLPEAPSVYVYKPPGYQPPVYVPPVTWGPICWICGSTTTGTPPHPLPPASEVPLPPGLLLLATGLAVLAGLRRTLA